MKMKELLLNIRVLLSPWVWMRNDGFNKHWDEIVRLELKKPITDLGEYTFKLGDLMLWKANGFFSLGQSYNNAKMPDNMSVSRKTALLLSDKLREAKRTQEPPQFYKDYKKQNSKLVQVLK